MLLFIQNKINGFNKLSFNKEQEKTPKENKNITKARQKVAEIAAHYPEYSQDIGYAETSDYRYLSFCFSEEYAKTKTAANCKLIDSLTKNNNNHIYDDEIYKLQEENRIYWVKLEPSLCV